MGKRGNDPLAKRKDETDLQWRSRVARTQETRRKQGEDIVTPETLAQGGLESGYSPDQERARTYRRRTTSSLARLAMRGVITDDQLYAAQELALISERIGRDVATASGNLSARVDNGSGNRDHAAESLRRVQIEQAYSRWRLAIPLPRQMILDMVREDNQLAAIARGYHRSWVTAIGMLREALDEWGRFKREAFDTITQDDVDAAAQRAA